MTTIDEGKRGLLISYQKQLQEIIDADCELGTDIEQLEGKLGQLNADVAKGKNGLDVLSDEAVAVYDAKVRHRDLVVEQLGRKVSARENLHEGGGVGLGMRLAGASAAVRGALAPGYEVLNEKVIAALLPFCESRERAALIAREQVPAMNVYSHWMSPGWGRGGGTLCEVHEALALIKQILEGHNPFKLYDGSSIDSE